MAFTLDREILAGNTLIAEAIQSQNFDSGVAGWQISAAGDAQFNNATIRGILQVGGVPSSVTPLGSGPTVSQQGTAGTTSFTVFYPAVVPAGAYLYLSVVSNGGITSTPAGWTARYSSNQPGADSLYTFDKIATGAEGGTSFVVTIGSVGRATAFMRGFTGVDPTTPINTFVSGTRGAVAGSTVTTGAGATTLDRCYPVSVVGGNAAIGLTWTPPAGFSLLATSSSGAGSAAGKGAAYAEGSIVTPLGAVGPYTWGWSQSNLAMDAVVVFLQPASSGGEVTIEPSVPPELVSYYSGIATITAFSLLMSPDGFSYHYQIVGILSTTRPCYATGWVNKIGQVQEYTLEQIDPNDLNLSAMQFLARSHDAASYHLTFGSPSGTKTVVDQHTFSNTDFWVGGAGPGFDIGSFRVSVPATVNGNAPLAIAAGSTLGLQSGSTLDLQSGSTLQVDAGAAFTIDGTSAPRGIVPGGVTVIIGNTTSGAVAGTESVMAVSNPATLAPGRVFRVRLANARYNSGSVQQFAVNLRKGTTVAGTQLVRGPRYPVVVTAGVDHPMVIDYVFCNSTGSPVVTQLCLTANPNVAASVTWSATAAPGQVTMIIEDIGDTTTIPGQVSV